MDTQVARSSGGNGDAAALAEAAMTVADWASMPEPWSWIGPQFRRECEQIVAAPATVAATVKARRLALGLTQSQLDIAAGYSGAATHAACNVEQGTVGHPAKRILAALARVEAERAQ